MGIGTAGYLKQVLESREMTRRYDRYEMVLDIEEDSHERDQRNTLLTEAMRYISMESELVFQSGRSRAYAGIANGPDSRLGCRITLIRDATGEILYQTKLIDPGYYVEQITLDSNLKKGYYPCTAIWDFYEQEQDLPVGRTARKVVIMIEQ